MKNEVFQIIQTCIQPYSKQLVYSLYHRKFVSCTFTTGYNIRPPATEESDYSYLLTITASCTDNNAILIPIHLDLILNSLTPLAEVQAKVQTALDQQFAIIPATELSETLYGFDNE